MERDSVVRLYPSYQDGVTLQGLYLQHALHRAGRRRQPVVFSNFIVSLDGRIAVAHPETGEHRVPDAIANRRDWRLYQELAAQADVLLTSARHLRSLPAGRMRHSLPVSSDPEYADLHAWRRTQGLTPEPAVAILSGDLDLPVQAWCDELRRPVYVAVGAPADQRRIDEIEACGGRVLVTGEDGRVDGKRLVDALAAEGFHSIYSIAGPRILKTLMDAGVLERLYLTQVHRLLGGAAYDTLLEGPLLEPPADFMLKALYYDRGVNKGCGQFFSVYDVAAGHQR